MYLILVRYTRRPFFDITGDTETLYRVYENQTYNEAYKVLSKLKKRGIDPRYITVYPKSSEKYLRDIMARSK